MPGIPPPSPLASLPTIASSTRSNRVERESGSVARVEGPIRPLTGFPELVVYLIDEVRVATRSVNTLTPRERQILEALVQGNTTREIADRCGIGRQTVKNYVTVIYEKLGVCGRTELQRLADVQLAAEG
jgi:DNA-binding NarL/FixJ family response regulator